MERLQHSTKMLLQLHALASQRYQSLLTQCLCFTQLFCNRQVINRIRITTTFVNTFQYYSFNLIDHVTPPRCDKASPRRFLYRFCTWQCSMINTRIQLQIYILFQKIIKMLAKRFALMLCECWELRSHPFIHRQYAVTTVLLVARQVIWDICLYLDMFYDP